VAKLYAVTALLFVIVVGAIATSIVVGRMIDA
jgi:hypothetical protein